MKALPHFAPATSQNTPTLSSPPAEGVNLWVLSMARRCWLAGQPPDYASAAIMAFAGQLRPGRQLLRSEVERAIAKAYGTAHRSGTGQPRPQALPPAELAKLCPPIDEKRGLEFAESSPVPRPWTLPTAEILARLYRPDEFLALKQVNQCRAEKCQVCDLPELLAKAGRPYQFTTSSPVTGRIGVTQNGKLSYGAQECFTDQRYVVIEFDSAGPQEQVARILWLKEKGGNRAPLVMMLKSGGKSFHGWFLPDSADSADRLKIAGVKLGADPAAMRISQPVRCPNQFRDNGQLQQVLYLAAPSLSL